TSRGVLRCRSASPRGGSICLTATGSRSDREKAGGPDVASHLGIDVGTSSVKAGLIDSRQNLVAERSMPLEGNRPQPPWSQQDPPSWWNAAQAAVGSLRTAAPRQWGDLASIGLSGQQHGATLLDAAGKVLRPCILWNDGRAGAECRELLENVADFTTRSLNITMPGFT